MEKDDVSYANNYPTRKSLGDVPYTGKVSMDKRVCNFKPNHESFPLN